MSFNNTNGCVQQIHAGGVGAGGAGEEQGLAAQTLALCTFPWSQGWLGFGGLGKPAAWHEVLRDWATCTVHGETERRQCLPACERPVQQADRIAHNLFRCVASESTPRVVREQYLARAGTLEYQLRLRAVRLGQRFQQTVQVASTGTGHHTPLGAWRRSQCE